MISFATVCSGIEAPSIALEPHGWRAEWFAEIEPFPCALRVAHNLNFDNRIIRIALMRYAGEEEANAFKALPGECTALLSKPVCQLPPTEAMKRSRFKNSYKTPTLAEAFKFLSGGKELGTQHRAFDDAQACARVYFMLKGIRMPEFPDDVCALREEEPQELSF